MKITNRTTTVRAGLAVLAIVALPGAGLAHTPGLIVDDVYDTGEQISAYAAKRLARTHLCTVGFCSRFGPGSARVRSITRDAGWWVLDVRVSNGGAAMSAKHTLYVDARTGAVSEERPDREPTPVAAE